MRLLPALIAGVALGCADTPADRDALEVADAGLATPESVLHDAVADVYLVSNINGSPFAEDDNGFIARIRPDGTMDQLKWINGESETVELHAPKGLAIIGDTLFVADIAVVRMFHRESGAPLGGFAVDGATFLNDLASDRAGTLYITDSGLGEGFAPSGTDALWQRTGGDLVPMLQTQTMGNPNGVVATDSGPVLVTFGSGEVYRVQGTPAATRMLRAPTGGQFDGVVRLPDGALLVSSWGAGAVYRIATDGAITVAVDSVPSPADIGWDAARERVLIPIFNEHRVVIRRID